MNISEQKILEQLSNLDPETYGEIVSMLKRDLKREVEKSKRKTILYKYSCNLCAHEWQEKVTLLRDEKRALWKPTTTIEEDKVCERVGVRVTYCAQCLTRLMELDKEWLVAGLIKLSRGSDI